MTIGLTLLYILILILGPEYKVKKKFLGKVINNTILLVLFLILYNIHLATTFPLYGCLF